MCVVCLLGVAFDNLVDGICSVRVVGVFNVVGIAFVLSFALVTSIALVVSFALFVSLSVVFVLSHGSQRSSESNGGLLIRRLLGL